MHVFAIVDAATIVGACADVKPNVLTSFLKFFFGELWFLLFVRLIFPMLHMALMFELGQFILF